jgi:hypothetical protein
MDPLQAAGLVEAAADPEDVEEGDQTIALELDSHAAYEGSTRTRRAACTASLGRAATDNFGGRPV